MARVDVVVTGAGGFIGGHLVGRCWAKVAAFAPWTSSH